MTNRVETRRRAKRVKSSQIWPAYIRPLDRLFERAKRAGECDPQIAEIAKQLEEVRVKLWALRGDREMREAEVADNGVVLWEVFSPRTKTPLNMSMFDAPRHVIRTPNRVKYENNYGLDIGSKPEFRLTREDPWKQLEAELARDRKTPEEQARYDADIEECLRRQQARRTYVVKYAPDWATPEQLDRYTETCEVIAESEAVARQRFDRGYLGGSNKILSIEEKWEVAA